MRTLRLTSLSTLAATAVLLAFAGIAQAQSQGGRGGGSEGGSSGGDAPNGALVLYGERGNCPASRGCDTYRPPRTTASREACSRWEVEVTRTGRHVRVCRED